MTFTEKPFSWQPLTYHHQVYTIHNMSSRELIRRLEDAGWTVQRVKGSHHILTHPNRPGHITIPHPKKDLGSGLVTKILKQAGIHEVTP
ncbi:MAG: type II toxin-antitoxin system HicA family toxin [Desulfoprunum sp.]|jgi:predicted RNA binding protein YcfA (HicA-like mRNA interferase family)